MKRLLRFFLFFAVAPSLAHTESLLPSEHSTCLNASVAVANSYCSDEADFYFDQDGKCGCLSEQDITSPDVCLRAPMVCNEAEGQSFSTLYQYRNQGGLMEIINAGCGCYTVLEAVHAVAVTH